MVNFTTSILIICVCAVDFATFASISAWCCCILALAATRVHYGMLLQMMNALQALELLSITGQSLLVKHCYW